MFQDLNTSLKKLVQDFPVGKELGLVSAGAFAHGIDLSPGDFFKPLHMTSQEDGVGAYNDRSVLPGEDTSKLAALLSKVESLTVICEDYRQSAQAVTELGLDLTAHKDAVLAVAGGPTQPREGENSSRHQTLVEFIANFHKVNQEATIYLIAHDQRCGGHAHFVGTAAQALEESGREAEDDIMIADLKAMAQDLIAAGVDPTKLILKLAQVNADDSYQGLMPVEL